MHGYDIRVVLCACECVCMCVCVCMYACMYVYGTMGVIARMLMHNRCLVFTPHVPGVRRMVEKSVSALGIDLVKAMYANVVLAGGTSMLTGMAERVRGELSAMVPGTVEVTVHEPPQRHLAAWVGGSILASAKHFGFHWVSREEYLEYGLELAHTV